MTKGVKRLLPGFQYKTVIRQWQMAEFEYRRHGWPHARRFCVARRFIADDSTSTLFSLGRHVYRVWVTNMNLYSPCGVWRFYDGRATIEQRILERWEDFALRKIPTKSFSTNAL